MRRLCGRVSIESTSSIVRVGASWRHGERLVRTDHGWSECSPARCRMFGSFAVSSVRLVVSLDAAVCGARAISAHHCRPSKVW
jgi:hypothetical protein